MRKKIVQNIYEVLNKYEISMRKTLVLALFENKTLVEKSEAQSCFPKILNFWKPKNKLAN